MANRIGPLSSCARLELGEVSVLGQWLARLNHMPSLVNIASVAHRREHDVDRIALAPGEVIAAHPMLALRCLITGSTAERRPNARLMAGERPRCSAPINCSISGRPLPACVRHRDCPAAL